MLDRLVADAELVAAIRAWGLAFAPVRTRWLRLAVVPLNEVPVENLITAIAAAPAGVRVVGVFANSFPPVRP